MLDSTSPPTPIKSTRSELHAAMLIFALVALVLAVPLGFNVINRMRAETAMRAAVAKMAVQVENNRIKESQLRRALAYAKSEAYTEQWARAQAHWARPDEFVVVMPNESALVARPWWEAFVTR
jgi:hypothetical protein